RFDIAAVERDAVARGYLVFDHGRVRAARDVNDAVILNIRPRADAYVIHVASENRSVPDARMFADNDIADDNGCFGDEGGRIYLRHFVFEISDHLRFLNFAVTAANAFSSSPMRSSFAARTNVTPPSAIGTK